MSLISGLGHIFHGIGNFFDGNDDDQKKKQQNSGVKAPTVVRPTQNLSQSPITLASQPEAIKSPNLNITALQKLNTGIPLGPAPVDQGIPLQKVNPTQTTQAPAAPAPKRSFGYKLTHNVVTNLAGGIVKPTLEMAHGLEQVPHAIYREVQNKPIDDIQKDVYGTTDSGKLLKKIVGDTINTGLLVAAPGVDNLAEVGVKTAAGETAEQLAKATALHAAGVSAQDALRIAAEDTASTALTKIAPKVISGAVVGGGSGATNTYEQGGNVKQILKSAATNALVGGATAGFFSGIPVLAKAVAAGHITPAEADSATEVAEGVHTVNASRPTDAAAQVGAPPETPTAPHQSGVVDDAIPAPIPEANIAPIDPNTVPQPIPEAQPISPDEMHPTETDSLKAMNDAAKTRKLTPSELEARDSLQAKQDSIAAANAPAVEAAEKAPTKVPAKGAPLTAENAPGIRDALEKKMASIAKADSTSHDVLSNQDLLDAGREHADTYSDKQLVDEYKKGFSPHGADEVAQGHAAIERLNKIISDHPDDEDAKKALDNLMEGAEKEVSGGGRTVKYAQQFYDGLQGPAKTSYLMRSLNRVRQSIGRADYTEDEAKAVTETIQKHVDDEQKVKGAISTLENRKAELQAEAEKAQAEGRQVSKANTKEGVVINKAIKARDLELSKNTSDLGKFYEKEAPQKLAVKAKAGDFGRSLMLSSIAGRGNNLATTSLNVGHQLIQNTGEALLGKSLRKAPGQLIDTLPSTRAFGRGLQFGLKKTVARFKGDIAGGDSANLLKKAGGPTGKGQLLSGNDGSLLSKVTAPVRRVVRSATEIATDVSEGIREQRIQQLATQEGKKAGLTGENLKSWAASETASPTRAMRDAGDQLQAEVNNMQDNKLTDALGGVSESLAKIPVVGEQVKNILLPFTRWTGGAIHNAVTDKNVVANVIQFAKAAGKKDAQGMVTAAAKAGVNGVGSIAAGYGLAKAGLITHQNAQGYDDDGLYLHVDGRYIPAGFLGFFAPGIIMGSAAHDAMANTNKDGKHNSILDQTLHTVTQTLKNTALALGAQQLTGESNPIISAFNNASKDGYTPAVVKIIGDAIGDYVPAITGDINAGLNNGIGVGPSKIPFTDITNPLHKIPGTDFLNRSHEASETKVTQGSEGKLTKAGKPSQAADPVKTAVNEELNKIPVVSQLAFGRKEGVAAPDEVDRVTRGDRDTSKELQDKADVQTTAKTQQSLDDRIAANNKAGIPDPDADSSSDSTQHYAKGDTFKNAVENRVENGKYDQALAGLNLQLDNLKSSKDATSAQIDPVQKQIAVTQVLKDGKYDPSIRDDYSKVSVSEWRDMGDPDSDTYNPAEYQKLFTYDSQLAAHDASDNTNDSKQPKYTVKDTSKASSSKAASDAASKIRDNKLSATNPGFKAPDLSNLSPQKVSQAAVIPTIQKMQAGDLIKKRKISVS